MTDAKMAACLWYDGDAEDAATFYAATFPDSRVDAVHTAPGGFPNAPPGNVLTVEFTVCGMPMLGLNGGAGYPHTQAVSFQIYTDDQAETDRLWNAVVTNGGEEQGCGWCRDRWGVFWQITPRALMQAMTNPDKAASARAMAAMMTMRNIDIAAIRAAERGDAA